jgi:hypothetical protein
MRTLIDFLSSRVKDRHARTRVGLIDSCSLFQLEFNPNRVSPLRAPHIRRECQLLSNDSPHEQSERAVYTHTLPHLFYRLTCKDPDLKVTTFGTAVQRDGQLGYRGSTGAFS